MHRAAPIPCGVHRDLTLENAASPVYLRLSIPMRCGKNSAKRAEWSTFDYPDDPHHPCLLPWLQLDQNSSPYSREASYSDQKFQPPALCHQPSNSDPCGFQVCTPYGSTPATNSYSQLAPVPKSSAWTTAPIIPRPQKTVSPKQNIRRSSLVHNFNHIAPHRAILPAPFSVEASAP